MIDSQKEEDKLLKELPPSLRDEVLCHIHGDIINFLKEIDDPEFIWEILPLLRPMNIDANEVLYWKGDHASDSKDCFLL